MAVPARVFMAASLKNGSRSKPAGVVIRLLGATYVTTGWLPFESVTFPVPMPQVMPAVVNVALPSPPTGPTLLCPSHTMSSAAALIEFGLPPNQTSYAASQFPEPGVYDQLVMTDPSPLICLAVV